MSLSPDRDAEMARLVARAESLRASIARAHLELKNASAQERAIAEQLAQLTSDPPPSVSGWATAPVRSEDGADAKKREADAPTVITSRTLETWRRRAIGVALGAATLTSLSVVGLLQLMSSEPARPALPVLTPAAQPPPIAVVAPPAAVPVASTQAEPSVPAPVRRAPPATNPYVGSEPSRVEPSRRTPREDADARAARETDKAVRVLREAEDNVDIGAQSTYPAGTAPGSLTVVCLPVKCDQVRLDGVSIATGHLFSRATPAGVHMLTAHAPNGVVKTLRIEIWPDQLRDIRLAMVPGDIPSSRD